MYSIPLTFLNTPLSWMQLTHKSRPVFFIWGSIPPRPPPRFPGWTLLLLTQDKHACWSSVSFTLIIACCSWMGGQYTRWQCLYCMCVVWLFSRDILQSVIDVDLSDDVFRFSTHKVYFPSHFVISYYLIIMTTVIMKISVSVTWSVLTWRSRNSVKMHCHMHSHVERSEKLNYS